MTDPIQFRWQQTGDMAHVGFDLPSVKDDVIDLQVISIKGNKIFQKIKKEEYGEAICTTQGLFLKKKNGEIVPIEKLAGLLDRREIRKINEASRAIVRQAVKITLAPLFEDRGEAVGGAGSDSMTSSPLDSASASLNAAEKLEETLQREINTYHERSEALSRAEDKLNGQIAKYGWLKRNFDRQAEMLRKSRNEIKYLRGVVAEREKSKDFSGVYKLQIDRVMSSIREITDELIKMGYPLPREVEDVSNLTILLCKDLEKVTKELERVREGMARMERDSLLTHKALEEKDTDLTMLRRKFESDIEELQGSIHQLRSQLEEERKKVFRATDEIDTATVRGVRIEEKGMKKIQELTKSIEGLKAKLEGIGSLLNLGEGEDIMSGMERLMIGIQETRREDGARIAELENRVRELEGEV